MEFNFDAMVERLTELREQGAFLGKRIVLFGVNKTSKLMYDYFVNYSMPVEAIIDNNKSKWGDAPFGVMTYNPDEYMLPFCEDFIVLIISQHYEAMTAQLEKMGYDKDKHIYVVQKLFRKYDVSEDAFEHSKKRIQYGRKIYEEIIIQNKEQLKQDNDRLLICPYAGNGDIYVIGKLLKEYLHQYGIGNYVITVVGKVCSIVGDMFGLEMVVLSEQESDALVSYVRFCGLERCKAVILNDCYQLERNKLLRGYKGLDFYKMFQAVVFNLPLNQRIACSEYMPSDEAITEYAKNCSMIKGKSVILSPYANTINLISVETWQEIAKYYTGLGYKVYTNAGKEAVIQGTESLFAPFTYMRKLTEYAGTFIGIRSGLCDIIAGADARKVILYPKGKLFGSCTTYDYFSLNKMGLCEDAIELEYADGESKELLRKICN